MLSRPAPLRRWYLLVALTMLLALLGYFMTRHDVETSVGVANEPLLYSTSGSAASSSAARVQHQRQLTYPLKTEDGLRAGYMIINNDMSRPDIPGNRRSAELAIALKRVTGRHVLHISRDGPVSEYFKRLFDAAGVEYQSYHDNPRLQVEGLLKDARRFGRWEVVFLHLWFWGPDTVPESYLRSVRAYSPKSKVVIVSDDFHGYRERMVMDSLQVLSDRTPQSNEMPSFRRSLASRSDRFVEATVERERLAYLRADFVAMVSERDVKSLQEQAPVLGMRAGTLHWTHTLHDGMELPSLSLPPLNRSQAADLAPSPSPFQFQVAPPPAPSDRDTFTDRDTLSVAVAHGPEPAYPNSNANKGAGATKHAAFPAVDTGGALAPVSADQLPLFQDRNGIIFVGFSQNPTNILAMQWFFTYVMPLISQRLVQDDVPLVLIGNFEEAIPLAQQYGVRVVTNKESLSDEALVQTLQSARVLMAPITASTGVNTKTLLAWSSGVPVVCSEIAAEGFRWDNDTMQQSLLRHAFLAANTPEEFAAALLEVYYQPAVWRQLVEGGLRLSNYMINSARFRDDIEQLLLKLRNAPPLKLGKQTFPENEFDLFRSTSHLFDYEWSRNQHSSIRREPSISWPVIWINVVVVLILYCLLGRPRGRKDRYV